MDIQEFKGLSVENFCTIHTQLWNRILRQKYEKEFFSHKDKKPVPLDKLPERMKKLYPDAKITFEKVSLNGMEKEQWKYIVLPNVGVERLSDWGTPLFIEDIKTGNYCRIADPMGLLKDINEQMPKWKEEFRDLCKKYETELKELEYRRLEFCVKEGETDKDNIQYRLDDFLLLERSMPCDPEQLLQEFNASPDIKANRADDDVTEYLFQNMRVHFLKNESRYSLFVRENIHHSQLKFNEKELSLKKIQEIDRQLPIWEEETKSFLFELQKKKKTDQIGQNVLQTLVKQKMRELGLEYHIQKEELSGNIALTVKLKKRRMLRITLHAVNLELVQQQLDELAQHVDILDQLSGDYRLEKEKKERTSRMQDVVQQLAEQRMKELGLEYRIEKDPWFIKLVVKLENQRCLRINLPVTHPEWVEGKLANLAQDVAALNQIPEAFCIVPQNPYIEWKKEKK